MKPLCVAFVAALVLPGAAQAAPLSSLAARELPLRGGAVTSAHARFDLVGLHWRGPGSVRFRTHRLAGGWSPWRAAAPEAEDLPNRSAAEAGREPGWRIGNPWWSGPSDRLQVRTDGRVERVKAFFVSSSSAGVPLRRVSVASSPPVIPRASWRANEAIRRAPPVYAPSLQLAIVHHTAGTNSYTASQSAAIVRGIEIYHVQGNGWNDIGYNFLVDKYGQVFEGRYGGIDRNVVGAHAEGFNTGSVGIALLGNYNSAAPSAAALRSLTKLIAWRLDVAHVDPLSSTTFISGGNAKFPSGLPVSLRAVSGHRDTGFTDCPGANLYARLAAIAAGAQATGLPKIFEPTVQGDAGGLVRFHARLSAPVPWTVTVLDPFGSSVDAGSGAGSTVDWTWDATLAPPGRYTYEIDADAARPATGVVGGGATTAGLTLTASPASAVLTPNGDGRSDTLTVRWTLGAPAEVTATVLDANDELVATLLDASRNAGSYVLAWKGSALPDGQYRLVLDATSATGETAEAVVPVLLDRTLAGFKASSHYLSPNGDGKLDALAFSFALNAPAHVSLRVQRGKTVLGSVFEGDLQPGPQRYVWRGDFGAGLLPDGPYQALVSSTDQVGTVSQGATFTLDMTAPVLKLVSGPKLNFRLSERAVVRLTVDGKRIVKLEKAGAFHVPHAGPAAKVTAIATDPAGNQSLPVTYP